MRFDYVERDCPKVRATCSRVGGIHAVNETIDRELATQRQDAKKQANEQRRREADSGDETLQPTRRSHLSPLILRSPNTRYHDEKEDLQDETYDAAAGSSHYQSNAHQSGRKQVEQSLFFIDRAGKQQTQWQRNRELHVTCKMMSIDKRTKGRALRELANPVNISRNRERLRQSEDRQEETKDYDRPHQHAKTVWCIDK